MRSTNDLEYDRKKIGTYGNECECGDLLKCFLKIVIAAFFDLNEAAQWG